MFKKLFPKNIHKKNKSFIKKVNDEILGEKNLQILCDCVNLFQPRIFCIIAFKKDMSIQVI